MEYDYKILEEKFKQLPEEIQHALSSIEVSETIKGIGEKHGLKIDQEGILYDQVALIMLGLMSSKDFVKDFSREANLDEKAARAVADDINSEVFGRMRSSMQSIQRKEDVVGTRETTISKPAGNNSALERAGGFEIEQEIPGNGEAEADRASTEAASMTETDKANMLSDIENPRPSRETYSTKPGAYAEEPHTEPMIDQLLKGPAAITEEKVKRNVVETPRYGAPEPKPQPPQNLPTSDPYREATK